MIELNLLPSQNVLSRREMVIRRWVVVLAGVVGIVAILDLAVFWGIRTVLQRQVSGVLEKRASLGVESEKLAGTALDLKTVEEKSVGVKSVRQLRKDFSPIILEIRSFTGTGLEIAEIRIDSSRSLFFAARVKDLASLSQFISRISGENQKTQISKAVLSGLRQDVNGGFSFQVAGVYNPN